MNAGFQSRKDSSISQVSSLRSHTTEHELDDIAQFFGFFAVHRCNEKWRVFAIDAPDRSFWASTGTLGGLARMGECRTTRCLFFFTSPWQLQLGQLASDNVGVVAIILLL